MRKPFIILILLLLASCGPKKADKSIIVNVAPALDKQIGRRKNVMQDSIRNTYTHAEMWDLLEAFTQALEDSAAMYQSKIDSVLTGPVEEAYTAEREAFSKWYDYQEVVASDVIVEIWQLYIGGTAGVTLYEMHHYDRVNANMTEQEILFNALTKHSYAAPYQSNTSMEEILKAKESLVAELKTTYSFIDNEDNWHYLDHTADEVEEFISTDLSLFQKWISSRKNLESLLTPDASTIVSSQTGYWLDLYMQTVRGMFIKEYNRY